MTRPRNFRQRVETIAQQALSETLPPEQVAQAYARVALSFASAHRTARDPSALEDCTDASIGACIAQSALTGLMPGGSHALVYLVPQRPRRDSPFELQWRPTHRGYAALAYEEAGLILLPVSVYTNDATTIKRGEVLEHTEDESNDRGAFRGVFVLIRRASDGVELSCPWISKSIVEQSRAKSDNASGKYSPWTNNYAEMAMASAIRYCHGRGSIPSTSTRFTEAMSEQAQEQAAPYATQIARPAPLAIEQDDTLHEDEIPAERQREPARILTRQDEDEDSP